MKTDRYLLDGKGLSGKTFQLDVINKNESLWQTYQDKKSQTPMLFPTEGAKLLGVSEFELLLSSPDNRYLGIQCRDMLFELESLGELESIVRNDYAVHEKQGVYSNLKIGEMMGLAINAGGLDLRIFIKKWAHMLAIKNVGKKTSYSIGFFDKHGQAINKAFLVKTDDDSITKWHALTDKYAQNAQGVIELESVILQGDWQYHELISTQKEQFHQDWQAMTDIHQFHGILSKYELDRASSYHQAPQGTTIAVKPQIIEALFNRLKDDKVGCMIFVGNTGMVQIESGLTHNIKRMGDWLNILDHQEKNFTLHLKDKALKQVWYIQRPNSEGHTTAFEAFDDKGNSIITIFGERTEGQVQCPKWQALALELAQAFALSH